MLFHVLGPLEVHAAAVHRLGAGKPATVLSVLLLHTNAWVTVDRLVASVWPEEDAPASAAANLKTYVWQLRRMLGGDRIERRADAYRLRVAPGEVDADRAGLLAAEADGLVAAGDPRAAAVRLTAALALWRGRPFCGVEAAAVDAARLDELRLDLAERLAGLHLELGRAADAVAGLRAVTDEAPLREPAWAGLVRALHATGRRTEAVTAFRRACVILDTELGVDPGPELAAAHRLAAGGPRPGPARRELPRDVRLVGRDGHLEALLRPAAVALVYGMAGAGKTALAVHAAHRLAPGYPDGQVFVHLRGSGPDAALPPAAALERLLRGIGVPADDIPADTDERAALWRSLLTGRRVLVLLDDAVDGAQVTPLLPAGDTCRTLVTTRNRGWHPAGATRIAVRPLAAVPAAALFAAAAGTPPASEAVATVVRHCGGLPAALLDAATLLRTRPHWTVQRLADELADDPCRVLPDACRRLDCHESAAWRALGRLPAAFDAAAAARALGVTPVAARAALESLVECSLLDAASPESFRSHTLVRHLAGCHAPTTRSPRPVR